MEIHCRHCTVLYIYIYINISHFKCVYHFFPSFVSVFSLDPNEEYKMNHKKRGMALIFNHENFYWHLRLHSRSGTNADRDNLVRRYLAKQDMLID